jgi:hypothetical protein
MANTDALQDLEMKTFLDTVDAAVAMVLKRHSELTIDDLIIEEFQPDDFDGRQENDWTSQFIAGANAGDYLAVGAAANTTGSAWNARCEDGKLAMVIGGFYPGTQDITQLGHMTVKVEDNEARRWGGALIDQDFRWITLAPLVVMEGKRVKIQPTFNVAVDDSSLFPFGMAVREK